MKAKTISIYVGGKLVLRATDLSYDEDTGKKTRLLPPSVTFAGNVGAVLVQDSNGAVYRAAQPGANELEIVAELF